MYYDCLNTYLLFEPNSINFKSVPIHFQIDTNDKQYIMIV